MIMMEFFYYEEADDAQEYIEEYLKIEKSAEFKEAKKIMI